jgi:hypothetical protein
MNALANIKTITKRELAAYFSSPLAYVFIVIFLLLCGFFTFFVGGFFEINQASLVRPFFIWHPWFYLFLVPPLHETLGRRTPGRHIELLLLCPSPHGKRSSANSSPHGFSPFGSCADVSVIMTVNISAARQWHNSAAILGAADGEPIWL